MNTKWFSLTLILVGSSLSLLGSIQEAPSPDCTTPEIEQLREVVSKKPTDADARTALANGLDDCGATEEAIVQYKQAIRLQPTNAWAHRNLGVTYVRKKDYEEAEAALREAVRLSPDYYNARITLASVFTKRKNWGRAVKEYREALRLDRKEAAAECGSNLMPVEREEFERARPDAAAHICVFMQLGGQDFSERARRELRWAIRLDPNFALAHQMSAFTYRVQGKLKEAIATAQTALRLNPKLPNPHITLGLVYEAQGKTHEAIAEYEAASQVAPEHHGAIHLLGAFYIKNGREKEALSLYERKLEANVADADVWGDLSRLYATAKDSEVRNLQKSLECAQKAVDLDQGTNPTYFDALAEAYFVNGELDKAIEAEKKAISLDPEKESYRERLKKFQKAKNATPNA